MAAPQAICTKEEERAVIRFLLSEIVPGAEIYQRHNAERVFYRVTVYMRGSRSFQMTRHTLHNEGEHDARQTPSLLRRFKKLEKWQWWSGSVLQSLRLLHFVLVWWTLLVADLYCKVRKKTCVIRLKRQSRDHNNTNCMHTCTHAHMVILKIIKIC